MFYRKITPKALSEKVMDFMLWPVSILAYAMVVLGALNIVLWLYTILQVRICGYCEPLSMK